MVIHRQSDKVYQETAETILKGDEMSNITFVREGNEVKIDNGFDDFCNVKIRIHDHCGVMLDLEDFYGEFSLEELELIVNKMKEMNLENQTIR